MAVGLEDIKNHKEMTIDSTGEELKPSTMDKLFAMCKPCPVDLCCEPCTEARVLLHNEGYKGF